MKKLAGLIGMLIVLAWGTSLWAAPLSATMYSNGAGGYSATDTSGGLVAINTLQGSLAWTVDQVGGIWNYSYTYAPATSGKPRGVGAVAIEFGSLPSDLVSNLSYISYTADPPAVTYPNLSGGLQTIDRTYAGSSTYDSWLVAADPAGSKVNVTTTFSGLQWVLDTTNPTGSSFTLLLQTSLAPVWGDVYMDGYNTTTNNGYGMFRNTNYDITASQQFSLDGPILAGYVPTPGAVPLPASIVLLGSGMGCLAVFRRKRVKS
jgi:hypothetical protein